MGEVVAGCAMGAARAEVPAEFVEALRELGLAGAASLTGEPLAGGVSSDIWRVDTEQGPVCVKRALARLRVAADWQAPIERNLYEARWMAVADEAAPGSAPRVLGQHPRLGVLVRCAPELQHQVELEPTLGGVHRAEQRDLDLVRADPVRDHVDALAQESEQARNKVWVADVDLHVPQERTPHVLDSSLRVDTS